MTRQNGYLFFEAKQKATGRPEIFWFSEHMHTQGKEAMTFDLIMILSLYRWGNWSSERGDITIVMGHQGTGCPQETKLWFTKSGSATHCVNHGDLIWVSSAHSLGDKTEPLKFMVRGFCKRVYETRCKEHDGITAMVQAYGKTIEREIYLSKKDYPRGPDCLFHLHTIYRAWTGPGACPVEWTDSFHSSPVILY